MKFKHILLIDDDEVTLVITKHYLEKSQICETVNIFTNGDEALDFINNNCVKSKSVICPIIIFVDNQMPDMDGFHFLKKLARIPDHQKNLSTFMMSAYISEADREKLKKYNIKGFFEKPLTLDKVKNLFDLII